ncbi:head decoration protein [Pseudomonas sp. F1_0610]|uniref:head decoration protein n=1 Tax=Pseudomonas sp. F1_0610 TaxID=3114284 RepID=UPI0039C40A02
MPNPIVTEFTPSNLVAGSFPIHTKGVVIAAGQVLIAGALLGINDQGHYVHSVKAATDGSQNPCAILFEDVDATDGPTPAAVALTGAFSGDALVLGEGHTLNSVDADLRKLSIFVC